MENIIDHYLDGSFDGAEFDREFQKKWAAETRYPMYAMAAPNVMDREPSKDVFLGRYVVMAMETIYGPNVKYLPRYQQRGTCVGQNYASSGNIVVATNSLLSGLKYPGTVSVAPIYGGSRVEVGKNPGRWDGSVGSWAARWCTDFGLVTMEELGLDASMKDEKSWLAAIAKEESMAVAWAATRDGVPSQYETAAKLRAISSAPMVSTVEEVRAALTNMTPVVLCGGVHPSAACDNKGVSKTIKRGGGHCTAIIGAYHDTTSGKWWYDHLNSWWYHYTGGFCRPDNRRDKMFKGSVTRIPEDWLMSWLRERDCYALVGVQGLEPVDPMFGDLLK